MLQQIIAERFLYAQRVYGRQLLKTKAAVSHQQMIGEDLDRYNSINESINLNQMTIWRRNGKHETQVKAERKYFIPRRTRLD